ncbi:MAG TPA: DUF3237 family protein [Solirubrobacteraceae bacterium]
MTQCGGCGCRTRHRCGAPSGERHPAARAAWQPRGLARQRPPPAGRLEEYMRIAPQFEVGAGRYAWLAESLFLGRGRLAGPNAIAYELYRVL